MQLLQKISRASSVVTEESIDVEFINELELEISNENIENPSCSHREKSDTKKVYKHKSRPFLYCDKQITNFAKHLKTQHNNEN